MAQLSTRSSVKWEITGSVPSEWNDRPHWLGLANKGAFAVPKMSVEKRFANRVGRRGDWVQGMADNYFSFSSEEYVQLLFQTIFRRESDSHWIWCRRWGRHSDTWRFNYPSFLRPKTTGNWALEVLVDYCIRRTLRLTKCKSIVFLYVNVCIELTISYFTVFNQIPLKWTFVPLETRIDAGCFSHDDPVKIKTIFFLMWLCIRLPD